MKVIPNMNVKQDFACHMIPTKPESTWLFSFNCYSVWHTRKCTQARAKALLYYL